MSAVDFDEPVFVFSMQQIKVCEHLPTSDTFCKSVYYLILAKKHQSQQFLFKGCSMIGLERRQFDMKMGGFTMPVGGFSGIFFEIT